jgi:putative hydrolase of the HAD superfamily
MTRPDVNFDRPARELVAHYGAASELASEVARILTAGLESQRPYPDTLAALDKLRKSYKLGLITNVGRPGYERLNADYDLKAHFDCLIPSYELGVVKPDPLMFRRALDLAGARPDEALMVGDNVSDDVEPARALSMRAVLLDRRNRFPDFPGRVTDLAQLMSSLQIT